MFSKPELRRRFRALRDGMSPEQVAQRSAAIVARVLALEAVQHAQTFFIYVSVGHEVETRGLMQTLLQRGRIVTVPLVTATGIMQAHRIESLDDLAVGRYNIPAPRTARAHTACVDICIAPGLAFTPAGERLGAGGGYYDRYLADHPAHLAIGLAYDVQIIDELPIVATDKAVDLIVTETRTIVAGSPR